ncbi:MAG: T9SS type A sorting domain-containing protein [Ignavibacteriae bacterium]|nr:T9SS type A sorting domain-containing protein [Ignavibacteriota bacterium]
MKNKLHEYASTPWQELGDKQRFLRATYLLLTMIFLQLGTHALAQWSSNPNSNTPICTATADQLWSRSVSDGAGGAIITWDQDLRNGGANSDIYVQRINASGWVQWTFNGVAISTAAKNQYGVQIVSDGASGAIITWRDYRNGTKPDIYAQRIDASGNVLWTADGVPISVAVSNKESPQIVSDGAGGAIITWADNRSGPDFNVDYDIYAQRINASGAVQWTLDGVPVSTAANLQAAPQIVSDGAGGAIIAWQDRRSGIYNSDDIYAQRIDGSGNVLWTADGVPISTAANNQEARQAVSDGAGGAIIMWLDGRRFAELDIYAQRIDASGAVQWTLDGVPISVAANNQWPSDIVSDGAGGAIITWNDERSDYGDIYAQRIDASGAVQWTLDGVAISTATNSQLSPRLVSDGAGGAIITWGDNRSFHYDIYAQRIDASGAVQWTLDGVPVSTAAEDQREPQIVSDGSTGTIITWTDSRSGTNWDIYAQKIDGAGNLRIRPNRFLTVTPDTIISKDGKGKFLKPVKLPRPGKPIPMPNWANLLSETVVQGGFQPGASESDSAGGMRIATSFMFRKNPLDPLNPKWTPTKIKGDTAWVRLTKWDFKKSMGMNFADLQKTLEDKGVKHDNFVRGLDSTLNPGDAKRKLLKGQLPKLPPSKGKNKLFAELVALKFNIAASQLGKTRVGFGELIFDVAGNMFDEMSIVDISAKADTMMTFWKHYTEEEFDSLYSAVHRINLAFAGPMDPVHFIEGLVLNGAVQIADIPFLRLPASSPKPIVLKPTTTETEHMEDLFEDEEWDAETSPVVAKLYANFPNPFNPSTTIVFRLRETSKVTLKIYNLLGQEVTTLLREEDMDEGLQTVEFLAQGLASGVYFYQVVAQANADPPSKVIETRKMLLIK